MRMVMDIQGAPGSQRVTKRAAKRKGKMKNRQKKMRNKIAANVLRFGTTISRLLLSPSIAKSGNLRHRSPFQCDRARTRAANSVRAQLYPSNAKAQTVLEV